MFWLNNLFMARFQLIRMSSSAKNKLQVSLVTQHQCWGRQMCEKFHKFNQYTHFLFVTRNDLSWLNYPLWQGFNSLGCPLMLRTNYTCILSLNISVNVAKCVENFQKFTQYFHFLSVTKKDLSCLINLFMARFELNSVSSYAKNKLQMCSVSQHQCKHCQMCGKFSQVHLLFVLQKLLVLTEQSIHGEVSHHYEVLLC